MFSAKSFSSDLEVIWADSYTREPLLTPQRKILIRRVIRREGGGGVVFGLPGDDPVPKLEH